MTSFLRLDGKDIKFVKSYGLICIQSIKSVLYPLSRGIRHKTCASVHTHLHAHTHMHTRTQARIHIEKTTGISIRKLCLHFPLGPHVKFRVFILAFRYLSKQFYYRPFPNKDRVFESYKIQVGS